MSTLLEGYRATIARLRQQGEQNLQKAKELECRKGSDGPIRLLKELAASNRRIARILESARESWKKNESGKGKSAYFFVLKTGMRMIPRELLDSSIKQELALAEESILPVVSMKETQTAVCPSCKERGNVFEELYVGADGAAPARTQKVLPCSLCLQVWVIKEES
jgi:hypothetical protein